MAGKRAGTLRAVTTKRPYDGDAFVDQNMDTYSVEYTFDDGTKLLFHGRRMNGATGHLLKLHSRARRASASPLGQPRGAVCYVPGAKTRWSSRFGIDSIIANRYQNEWDELVMAIRQNKPYNEVKRGVQASLVTSLGRMAAHTGQEMTLTDMLNCDHEFAPNLDTLTAETPSPLQPGPNGRYPVPQPGINTKREY